VRKEEIALTQKAEMTVSFVAHPVLLSDSLDLNNSDPEVRQAAVDRMRACLNEAIQWDACGFALVSGPDSEEDRRECCTSMLIASLKELCEHSRRKGGPPVLLEVFDRVSYGKNRLIGPTADASDVAYKVEPYFPNFGLVVNLGHLPLLGETPEDAVRAAGRHLRHVHLANCVMADPNHPAYGDKHPPFGIEKGENGVDELATFLKALLDIGYIAEGKQNIVSFDITPLEDMSYDDVSAGAKEILDAAWAAL